MKLYKIILPIIILLTFSACIHDEDSEHDHASHQNHDIHDGHDHKAHQDKHHDKEEDDDHDDEGIYFSKEQQKDINVVIKDVVKQQFRSSILTFGRFEFPKNTRQALTAPVSGIATLVKDIQVGTEVKINDILGYIAPTLGDKEDIATLNFELQRANANLSLAESEYSRLEKLKSADAISSKRFMEVQNALSIANAEAIQIQKHVNQLLSKGDNQSGIALRSRIDGKIISQEVFSGSFVNTGDKLIGLADSKNLWLNIQVSQDDMTKIIKPSGVTLYRSNKDITLDDKDMKVLYFSELIDPKTATASLVYALKDNKHNFRSGERLSLRLYTSMQTEYIAIPKSSIVDDNGVKVVYSTQDGKHFKRREVSLGMVDGDNIAVTSGLKVDEKIVVRGAYRIMLAGLKPAEAGHGHSH